VEIREEIVPLKKSVIPGVVLLLWLIDTGLPHFAEDFLSPVSTERHLFAAIFEKLAELTPERIFVHG